MSKKSDQFRQSATPPPVAQAENTLAQRLIAENKRSKARYLDLGNCGLIAVPAEVGDLVWLKSVSFSSMGGFDAQGEWEKCANDGPRNNGLRDISALAKLGGLQRLDLDGTAVADLTPLAGLGALKSLDLDHTQVSDLTPLAGLGALKSLNLDHTQVSDLTPLAGLGALRKVLIAATLVADLSPLRALLAAGVPATWGYPNAEVGIFLYDCPLTNPPPEIVQQGNAAILNYFAERDANGVDHLYEAKLLILGDGGAGKTTLLRRLYQPALPMPAEQETTKGIDIHRHEFALPNGRTFRLNVWDFGGQEIYHATHQFFLTRRSLYLLLDDTRASHKSVTDPYFRNWLDLIETFGDESPVLLFQNEKDGRSKEIGLRGIKGKYVNVKDLYKGDLKQPNAADKVCAAIQLLASQLSHIGAELPARWIQVRQDIETRATQTPHISQQEYFAIYARHLPEDTTKALHLSRYLHDLGVFLHFQDDPLLARIVILQNNWATEAVYRILDDDPVKAARGRFTRTDYLRVWKDSTYASMQPELLALMQNFELCYPLPDCQQATWLLPGLLPAERPDALQDWCQPDDLALRYRYTFLPKGIINRLMVRLNRFVTQPQHASLNCVPFARGDGETVALAELLDNGQEIELRARGPERKELLSVLAADLDAINDGFPGLRGKVEKLIPCHCPTCRTLLHPALFEESALRQRSKDGRLGVECPRSYENMSVPTLLDGARFGPPPGWAAKPEPQTVPLATRKETQVHLETGEPTAPGTAAHHPALKGSPIPDIFISFAHVDNEPVSGHATGWVSHFFNNLRTEVNRKMGRPEDCALWMDFRLKGSDSVTPEIEKQVRAAHILLMVLSPGWLASPWCQRELELFLHGRADLKGRIFLVELDDTSKAALPAALRDLLGYRFWQKTGTDRIRQAGWPCPMPERPEHQQYYEGLADLAADLAQALKARGAVFSED